MFFLKRKVFIFDDLLGTLFKIIMHEFTILIPFFFCFLTSILTTNSTFIYFSHFLYPHFLYSQDFYFFNFLSIIIFFYFSLSFLSFFSFIYFLSFFFFIISLPFNTLSLKVLLTFL